MNRAERRRLGKKNDEPTLCMKGSDVENLKKKTERESIDAAFKLLFYLPNMVIHDKWDILEKAENKEETFVDLLLEQYESFNEGYVSLEELKECFEEETGIKIEED